MTDWMALTARMLTDNIEPVVAAAVAAFSFVFIHPFEDSNGRIHRFIVHHVLSKTGFKSGYHDLSGVGCDCPRSTQL